MTERLKVRASVSDKMYTEKRRERKEEGSEEEKSKEISKGLWKR